MFSTIIIFVLILGLLVFVHELGHFIAAKKAGAKIEEFGFGFPPRLYGFKKGETIYSINLIPLGGFVKILGEDGENKKDPRSFGAQRFLAKIGILSAGVTMNVLLAMLLLMIAFKIGIPTAIFEGESDQGMRDTKIQIVEISPDSPAAGVGLKVGDQILKAGFEDIETISELQEIINRNKGVETEVLVKASGEEKKFLITPRNDYPENEGPLGVGLVKTGIISYPFFESIWRGFVATFSLGLTIILAFTEIIKNLLTGQKVGMDVAGPVGIAVMTNQAAKMGLVYLIQFTALLSVNLAIINFLPLPALDGGRVMLLIVEKIRRKPLNQKIERTIHTAGFVALILLMIVVTFRDIFKFKDVFARLWEGIMNLF